jgi:hypothetical protein
MQALLTNYSSAKHYNPHHPDAHLPNLSDGAVHDELGLVSAVTVKVSILLPCISPSCSQYTGAVIEQVQEALFQNTGGKECHQTPHLIT